MEIRHNHLNFQIFWDVHSSMDIYIKLCVSAIFYTSAEESIKFLKDTWEVVGGETHNQNVLHGKKTSIKNKNKKIHKTFSP